MNIESRAIAKSYTLYLSENEVENIRVALNHVFVIGHPGVDQELCQKMATDIANEQTKDR